MGSVGESGRTTGKHSLLKKLLNREVAVMPHLPYVTKEYTIVDLCAGDGSPSGSSNESSPEIISGYYKSLNKLGIKANMVFIEKDLNTYERLLAKGCPATHINCNSREIKSFPISVGEKSVCFIHADPNHIEDWPISRELLINSPSFTTMLITLGCNVGGLKRLPREARDKWFERMDDVLEWLPKRHDALLIALSGDKAQWAYMIIGPRVWHDKGHYKKEAKAAFKDCWEHGLKMVSLKEDNKEFYKMRDKLFLTVREAQNGEQ